MKECCIDFIEICKDDDWDIGDLKYCGFCGGKLEHNEEQ